MLQHAVDYMRHFEKHQVIHMGYSESNTLTTFFVPTPILTLCMLCYFYLHTMGETFHQN